MRSDGMGRTAARLYARRRQAIEQYVPFWTVAGQDGAADGQDGNSAKSLKTKAGQDGQVGQVGENAVSPRENIESDVRDRARAYLPVRAHGPRFRPDRPDRPDPTSNGAGLPGQDAPTPVLTVLTAHPWTGDRAWIGDIVRAETADAKLATLFSWVLAAGGWIEGMTAELPPLPRRLATRELHRMLRQSGIEIREDARP